MAYFTFLYITVRVLEISVTGDLVICHIYLESLHVLLKTVPCQVCLFLSTGLIIYWDCIGTLTENILLFIRLPKEKVFFATIYVL